MKKAFITGVTGQDGAYLSKHLLNQGYTVYGAKRRSASDNPWRLQELGIEQDIELLEVELLEFTNILHAIKTHQFDEVYNLAAQSFVGSSFEQPIYTSEVNGLGCLKILEAIRTSSPHTKFYQASTSEMFGKVKTTPQNEETPFHPRSAYGVSKLYAHWITINYREAHNLFCSSGILFNHESPLRGEEFVTRKITSSLAKIKYGFQETLELGNLDARRDWGFAGDYVEGMHKMLQQKKADDFVLATGETRSIREFIDVAAYACDFKIRWEGTGVEEKGIDEKTGHTIIKVNPKFYRPAEVDTLTGDASKAQKELNWHPKTPFRKLVTIMIESDLRKVQESKNANIHSKGVIG